MGALEGDVVFDRAVLPDGKDEPVDPKADGVGVLAVLAGDAPVQHLQKALAVGKSPVEIVNDGCVKGDAAALFNRPIHPFEEQLGATAHVLRHHSAVEVIDAKVSVVFHIGEAGAHSDYLPVDDMGYPLVGLSVAVVVGHAPQLIYVVRQRFLGGKDGRIAPGGLDFIFGGLFSESEKSHWLPPAEGSRICDLLLFYHPNPCKTISIRENKRTDP